MNGGKPGKAAPNPGVMIAMPMYRSPHPATVHKLMMAMDHFKIIAPGVDIGFATEAASAAWWARRECVKKFWAQTTFTHLIFLDDDMDWPEGQDGFNFIAHLIQRDKPIIGGVGYKRKMPTLPYAGRLNDAGFCETIIDLDVLDSAEPFRVDFIGFGMVCIKRSAIQTILESVNFNFDALFMQETNWRYLEEARTRIELALKDPETTPERIMEVVDAAQAGAFPFGEDYSFCIKAKRAGVEIWCDPHFELLHFGDYQYGIRDFIYQRKMKSAQEQGG